MNTRKEFLGGLAATFALAGCKCPLCGDKKGKIALQLYSIGKYIKQVGLAKALEDVANIGYSGVEFAGYYNFKAPEIKKMLDDTGLVACGTHVSRTVFSPEKIKETCEFELAYGNSYICCPGGGNAPAGMKDWRTGEGCDPKAVLEHMKMLCDYYNKAAETAATYGCKIGLHNHMWEFGCKTSEGSNFWDYFFSHTTPLVQMEQDVGWTTCAGFDPCEQFRKYPHRSFTLHAKENGMGKNVTKFDAILGQPGQPGAIPVDWDKLLVAAEADGVEWWVVECEKHFEDLSAVTPSYKFLAAKGLN